MVRRYFAIGVLIVAIATLASYGVWQNAGAVHHAGVASCRSIDASNTALVRFLRTVVDGSPRSQAFIRGLEANDRRVYVDCLAKVP